MFSQLGPLFKTQLRQAEKSDARLEIRRDEKQDQGKKHDFGEDEAQGSDFWEDSTAVSVEALKTFLTEFLKTRGEEDIKEATPKGAPAQRPEHKPAADSRTAQAMKAYGSMAAASPISYTPPQPEKESESVDLVDLLAADEVRTIHALITELDILSRKGVQTLIIEKAPTFLEALVHAVRAEKQKT